MQTFKVQTSTQMKCCDGNKAAAINVREEEQATLSNTGTSRFTATSFF